MRVRQGATLLVAMAVLVASFTSGAGATRTRQAANQATDVGVTATTIRIAVVADVDNPLRPGLFRGARDAVEAFGRYINANGGLAGRRVVVDFIDSHLSSSDARNAMITACSQDFAVVGTAALFLNNVDDIVGCKDQAGAPTGLPDLPVVTTEVAQQCSPVSFPINAPQLDCATKDQHPQTYRANIGPIQYYQRTRFKNLHGVGVYSNDIKSAAVGQQVLIRGANAGGVKPDGEFGLSATAPQSGYTPVAQAIASKGSNWAIATSTFDSTVSLRKEAQLQGVNPKNVVWDCFSQCYDPRFLSQGGTAVEGQYVTLSQLPFEEARYNKALSNYLKFAGAANVDGFGAYAWVAGLLLRDAVNTIVRQRGNNGLTRKALLDAVRNTTSFNADGMWGTANVGGRVSSPCFLTMQVQHGKFVRVYPSKPGTFDCKPSNRITFKADLFGG